jgi:hypothetical protein
MNEWFQAPGGVLSDIEPIQRDAVRGLALMVGAVPDEVRLDAFHAALWRAQRGFAEEVFAGAGRDGKRRAWQLIADGAPRGEWGNALPEAKAVIDWTLDARGNGSAEDAAKAMVEGMRRRRGKPLDVPLLTLDEGVVQAITDLLAPAPFPSLPKFEDVAAPDGDKTGVPEAKMKAVRALQGAQRDFADRGLAAARRRRASGQIDEATFDEVARAFRQYRTRTDRSALDGIRRARRAAGKRRRGSFGKRAPRVEN